MKKSGHFYSKSSFRKFLIVNLAAVGIAALYYFVLGISGITCPLRALVGLPCPACGTTTALISLVRGDITAYFATQPFALLLFAAVILAVNRSFLRKPLIADVFIGFVAVANYIYFILN